MNPDDWTVHPENDDEDWSWYDDVDEIAYANDYDDWMYPEYDEY